MVKRCALCGIVDNIADVSIHKFPSAVHRRREWVTFVEDQGFHVTLCSRLCSRHFVPGVDYAVGNVERRRLTTTAVPSLVVGRQLVPGVAEEPEGGDPMMDENEIDENAMMDDHIIEVVMEGVMDEDNEEEHGDVENMEVVMEDNVDHIIEVVMEDGVMDEDNVEIVDVDNMAVQMDDEVLPADVEIVDVLPGELEFMDIFHDFNPEVAVELPRVHAPRVDRPASVRHPLPDRHDIGPLNAVCRHCEARHFNCESTSRGHFTLCCNNNQMVIPEGPRRLQQAPELLQSLLVDDSRIATQFRKNIRRYNNTLAFAAFSTDLNQRRLPGRGPRVFTVHGQVYRRITNDVVRNDDRHPSYCELYFIESGEANRVRMNQNHQGELNETVLTDLDTMLRQTNPFAMAFSNMRAVWLEEQRIANANPLVQPRRVTMHLVADPNSDPRRYNLPPTQVNEVSVVFAGNNGQPPRNLDLVVFDSNPVNPQHRMQNLSYGSQHADPMLYPLLFPHGELGWHFELRQDDGGRQNAVRTRNTIREFVCYRLAIRYEGNNDHRHQKFSLIHRAGFLFQQYVCDQYVRMETNNLRFIERNQGALFAEAYQGLVDHINQQLHIEEPAPVGRRTILPSTFTGGPRYMKQSYQDAMTIVRKYGKPDLFITFTCNPGWPEIVSNKGNHAEASDRPELVARVFHAKLKQLMSDITENRVFGNVDAYVYTVEFQKRGLPHAHILIILSDGNKLLTAEDVDDVVCAELPDPADENNQRLFTAVTSHMIHGPCGQLNRNSPCMAEGICLKKYPKAYSAETVYVSDGGYPTYRRRDNGIEALVRGHQISNEFVVAYNPYLLAKYDAHINVEVCSTVKSVKYLYKYVFKGHDMATVEVQDRNEIENFINARYVSPPEAVWRLFSYELHKPSHRVIRLPVHLEDYHTVYFAPGQELERVQNAALARTRLTAFFSLNETDPEARQYLYHEIPMHYTWAERDRRWNRRRRVMPNETLSRMYAVNPLDRERFLLRLLLLHRRGPQSFRDMRTVDGIVYPTYAAAAVALGLLEDDQALLACMTESAAVDTPAQLRYLLVTILLYCEAADPLALYMASEEDLRQDFFHRLRDEDRARAACLDAIGRLLQGHGKTLADYGLPNPDVALLEEDAGGDVYAFVDAVVRWTLQLDNLNDEQRAVYDRVMAAVDDNRDVPKLFYVDGPGGTGKTTLYGCLIWSLRNMGRSVLSVAFTGIAATLMDGGMTVHSTFGLPFGTLNEDSTSSIAMQSLRARRIREAALIVWDEAPMSPGLQLTVVDRLLKDIMQSELPFGGKTVLFAGDFRQILPVVRRGTRAAIVAASIRHHHLWDVFERFSLTQNMRANNDADFAAWLLQLGNGQLPAVDGNVNTVEIPRNMVCDIANLIDFVYPQQMSLANVDDFARKIILCPRNEDCRQVNRTVLQRVTGAARTYTAIDTVVADDVDEIANYPTEFLNSLEPDGLPPYRLTLVVGSVVMLLRNLDPKIRLCNGTRLVVTELRRNNFKARLLADAGEGQDDIVIPRIPLSSSGDDDLPFTMRRVQFPVRLSFAMTINKSQGQTFDRVGLFLPSPVFTHGQLYVAFSRVRDSESIKVGMYGGDDGRFITRNIVYSDVL